MSDHHLAMIKSRAREIRDEVQKLATLGRDLNPTEEARLDGIEHEIKSLIQQKNSIRSTEATQAAIRDFGAFLDAGPTTATKTTTNPRVAATGGPSDWGRAVVKACSGTFGFKGVLATGSTAVTVPLDPTPVTATDAVIAVRQLVPTRADNAGRWGYMRQTIQDHQAAIVPHGQLKPTSDYTMERVEGIARTIAHLSKPIARQDLMDAPLLEEFIANQMRAGLEEALENQILNGDGTGENFDGMTRVSGTQAQAFSVDAISTIRRAAGKLEAINLVPSGVILNPADWVDTELAVTATFAGAESVAGPINRQTRRLWGIPVALSGALTAGQAVVFDSTSVQLRVREDGVLDWSEHYYDPDALGAGQGASDWSRNLLRFRFEGRFGWDTLRPAGIVLADLTAA